MSLPSSIRCICILLNILENYWISLIPEASVLRTKPETMVLGLSHVLCHPSLWCLACHVPQECTLETAASAATLKILTNVRHDKRCNVQSGVM